MDPAHESLIAAAKKLTDLYSHIKTIRSIGRKLTFRK
jgi:hypothetical protein